eukprot:Sspe_Gene.72735::Locus_43539_Transcript_1_1_Confidence_1.000_Length_2584::g.72735::m.72735
MSGTSLSRAMFFHLLDLFDASSTPPVAVEIAKPPARTANVMEKLPGGKLGKVDIPDLILVPSPYITQDDFEGLVTRTPEEERKLAEMKTKWETSVTAVIRERNRVHKDEGLTAVIKRIHSFTDDLHEAFVKAGFTGHTRSESLAHHLTTLFYRTAEDRYQSAVAINTPSPEKLQWYFEEGPMHLANIYEEKERSISPGAPKVSVPNVMSFRSSVGAGHITRPCVNVIMRGDKRVVSEALDWMKAGVAEFRQLTLDFAGGEQEHVEPLMMSLKGNWNCWPDGLRIRNTRDVKGQSYKDAENFLDILLQSIANSPQYLCNLVRLQIDNCYFSKHTFRHLASVIRHAPVLKDFVFSKCAGALRTRVEAIKMEVGESPVSCSEGMAMCFHRNLTDVCLPAVFGCGACCVVQAPDLQEAADVPVLQKMGETSYDQLVSADLNAHLDELTSVFRSLKNERIMDTISFAGTRLNEMVADPSVLDELLISMAEFNLMAVSLEGTGLCDRNILGIVSFLLHSTRLMHLNLNGLALNFRSWDMLECLVKTAPKLVSLVLEPNRNSFARNYVHVHPVKLEAKNTDGPLACLTQLPAEDQVVKQDMEDLKLHIINEDDIDGVFEFRDSIMKEIMMHRFLPIGLMLSNSLKAYESRMDSKRYRLLQNETCILFGKACGFDMTVESAQEEFIMAERKKHSIFESWRRAVEKEAGVDSGYCPLLDFDEIAGFSWHAEDFQPLKKPTFNFFFGENEPGPSAPPFP